MNNEEKIERFLLRDPIDHEKYQLYYRINNSENNPIDHLLRTFNIRDIVTLYGRELYDIARKLKLGEWITLPSTLLSGVEMEADWENNRKIRRKVESSMILRKIKR